MIFSSLKSVLWSGNQWYHLSHKKLKDKAYSWIMYMELKGVIIYLNRLDRLKENNHLSNWNEGSVDITDWFQ